MTRLSMTASEQAEGAGGPRILLVDDEPRIRDFISRALETAGYAVDAACSGTEGLRQAVASDYDLIILDLIMPDMDGRIFLAQLLRERREQGVLVLSCLADVTTKVDCLELGAQDYLTKPFSLAELLARVRVRLRDDAHPLNEVLRVGDLVLDVGRLEANIGHGPVRPDPARVPAAAGADGARGPVGGQGPAARLRVGVRLRPRLERGGRLRAPAALQARLRTDQDGAW